MLAAIFAFVLAKPIIHLRGDYLLIVTIGIVGIVRIALTNNLFGLTGGANGIYGIARPSLFGMVFSSPKRQFYLIWTFAILTMFPILRAGAFPLRQGAQLSVTTISRHRAAAST